MMASNECKLKVEDLPPGVASKKLKFFFQNTKHQGGGKVERVDIEEETHCAIITFVEKEAVDKVLSNGDSVTLDSKICKISRVFTGKQQKEACNASSSRSDTRQHESSSQSARDTPKQRPAFLDATIEIDIKDVSKPHDYYLIHFEDWGKGFYKDKIFMDGLKKTVYVTFDNPAVAKKLCREGNRSETNMEGIRMAKSDVFDHYKNLISIHGMDFSGDGMAAKLKQYVKEKTDLTPSHVLFGEEPCSAILVFEEDKDIYTIAWNCVGKLNGVQLFTALVKYCSTIQAIVTGEVDLSTTKKYLKNKGISQGGPIKSCTETSKSSLLVTFEDRNDAMSVSRSSNFANMEMTTDMWHHCLSKEAYEEYLIKSGQKRNAKQETNYSEENQEDILDGHTFVIPLEVKEYILLERSGWLSELLKSEKSMQLKIENGKHQLIHGSKSRNTLITNKIAEKGLSFETQKVEVFDTKCSTFLQESLVQEKMNEILKKENMIAYIFSDDNKIMCFFDKVQTRFSKIERILKNSLKVFKEICGDQIVAFTCNEGEKYLYNLKKRLTFPFYWEVKSNEKEIEIMLIEYEKDDDQKGRILFEFNKYLEDHKFKKEIPFPALKFQYVKTIMEKELNSLMDELKKQGVSVKAEEDKIKVTGLQSEVQRAEISFSKMREKITVQEENINFFGIMEFLASDKGTELLYTTSKSNGCLIRPVDSLSADGGLPNLNQASGKLIGTCDIEGLRVQFMIGDITSMAVDVIVNTVDNGLELKTGIAKIVGYSIQRQLSQFRGKKGYGDIVETDGGNLPCAKLFHLILEKDDKILTGVIDCLRKADQDNHKSIALPLIGSEKGVHPFGAVKSIVEAVKKYASKASSVNQVIIWDNDPKLIQKIIQRFGNVEMICSLDAVIDEAASDDDGDVDGSQPSQKGRDSSAQCEKFGPVTCTLKQGNIMEENCDVIVCGIRENMELRSGGAVSKALAKKCGSALQDECTLKVEEMEQKGVVAVSANGLPCSAIIFICMSRFKTHWERGVREVLQLANENKHTSIALPAFGSGSRHANIPRLKQSIYKGIKSFGQKTVRPYLKDVKIIILDKRIFDIFRTEKDRHHKDAGHDTQRPRPIVSHSVKLNIVHGNTAEGMRAIKETKEKIKEAFLKSPIASGTEISEKELKDLDVKGRMKQVQVTREAGCIYVGGFDHGAVTELIQEVYKVSSDIKDRMHKKVVHGIKTAFKWQFMRDNNRWSDFNPGDNINIENAFNDGLSHADIKDARNRTYRIDFKSMKELKIKGDKMVELTTVNRYDLAAENEQLPSTWVKMQNDNNVIMVPVPSTSSEYKEVQTYFNKCGASTQTIKKIERIQNLVLYQQYAAKKKYFEKANPSGTENEKRLFHGTDPNAVANINESGFNRSFCGKNATVYGSGVYFAEESSYSVKYAHPNDSGDKMMYLAKVLVGESTQSQNGMNYLPNKPNKNVPYDSGRGPKMYIIFNDTQAYPEYLITFT